MRPGDRVALAGRNRPEWAFTFWATQAIGAIAVPLNASWTTPELEYAVRDSAPTALFMDGARTQRLTPVLQKVSVESVVQFGAEGETPKGVVEWTAIVEELGDCDTLPDVAIDPDASATILYTSGTTGRPKGAVLTHRNHCTTIMNAHFLAALNARRGLLQDGGMTASHPVALHVLPWFHIGGLSGLYVRGERRGDGRGRSPMERRGGARTRGT